MPSEKRGQEAVSLPFVAVSLWPLLRSLALVAAVIVVVFIHQNGTLNN